MGKKSWAWEKIVIDVPPLDFDRVDEDFLQSMGSPEGMRSEEARDTVWPLLGTTRVDAKAGKFIWPDGKRLGIEHTVRRIDKDYPALGRDLIEDKVISWLEMEYVPKDYTPEQMDEFEELVDRWLEDHNRRATRGKTG
jgi:hypothetical protein